MLKKLFYTSRPRFWVYISGPFLIVLPLVYQNLDTHNFALYVVFLMYMTFPANLLVYGINDIYDYETDILNTKKDSYEKRLSKKMHGHVLLFVLLTTIPFLLYAYVKTGQPAFQMLSLFVVCAWQYSAPPLRAKAIPFVDSIVSALIYVLPGACAWSLTTGSYPSILPLIAGFLWSYAMHLYSAVPDIAPDTKADITTGATVLGTRGSLVLCGVLYAAACSIGSLFLGAVSYFFYIPYFALIWYSYMHRTEAELLRTYAYVPLINTLVGAVLFFLLWNRFGL
jgi:lycopene elongase/hydratase (dihydrobisanhydrobacterioruberin-forming)